MNNYAYCTIVTDKKYIPYIIRTQQRLKYLQSKYPFIILITENIYNKYKNIIEKNNIIYKIIDSLSFEIEDKHYKDTLNKFQILNLIEYEIVLFLDADIIIYNNIDNVFKEYNFSKNKPFYLFCKNFKQKIIPGVYGAYFFCRPNKELYNKYILNNNIIKNIENDQAFLNIYFYNCLSNIKSDDTIIHKNCIHFAGQLKLADLQFFSFFKNFFIDWEEKTFNSFLDDEKNIDNLQKLIIIAVQTEKELNKIIKKINYKF